MLHLIVLQNISVTMAFESDEGDRLSQEPFLEEHPHPYNDRRDEFDAAATSRRRSYCLICSLSFNAFLLFIMAVLLYALNVNREANTDPSILLPRKFQSKGARVGREVSCLQSTRKKGSALGHSPLFDQYHRQPFCWRASPRIGAGLA